MEKLSKIKFDLNEYQIILQFHDYKDPLVIHFDTPSRRFYFSIIVLILYEMKKQDKPGFIHIHKHQKTLKLLDKSLSGKHVSKHTDAMWAKINMAWRHRLPDLETASLFKVLDRDLIPPYERGGKYRYDCSDDECDIWANLFGYDENNKWRFKLAFDSASLDLDDTSIVFGNLRDDSAFQEYLKSVSPGDEITGIEKVPEDQAKPKKWIHPAVAASVIILLIFGGLIIKNIYYDSARSTAKYGLEKKPSIAVLPFSNFSNDPDQDYLADGLTENIITALSKVSEMFVISRYSTFVYKNRAVKVQTVGKELGVSNVLEGSVQKSGNRIRISAQLIDTRTGYHLWSESFDSDIKNLFDLQDKITTEIVVELQVNLTEGEQARLRYRSTNNFKAWGKVVKAYSLVKRFTKEKNAKARKLLEEAVKLDPQYAYAWTWLACTHWSDARYGFSESKSESFKKAVKMIHKAMSLDDSNPDALALLGLINLYQRKHGAAITEGKKAISLGPSNAENHALLAMTLFHSGNFKEAIAIATKAMRLSPHYPPWYLLALGAPKLFLDRYDEALESFKRCLERSKKEDGAIFTLTHLYLAATYIELGRDKEANKHSAEILKVNPQFSLDWVREVSFLKNPKHMERWLNALRKAGIPETSTALKTII